tara:strand:- start:1067 stop:1747 length:681 start_codon:yes stop_codon:yes gene_type:complete
MEVAPHELAQLLKLAGIGGDPEPEVEPEVSVVALPSDDEAPVGGGCGDPHSGGDMRGIIDMLTGADEPIEEAPPKDYENASNEFIGHPEEVISTYDDFSYEPARHSGGQRRTNTYGDNPLREEDMIKEYTEYKKKKVTEQPGTIFGSKSVSPWEYLAPTWLGGKSHSDIGKAWSKERADLQQAKADKKHKPGKRTWEPKIPARTKGKTKPLPSGFGESTDIKKKVS